MRNKVLTIIALLAIAGSSAWANETTVTYRMKVETNVNGDPFAGKITFVRDGEVLGNLTGDKVVNITNVRSFEGFRVTLDDGLYVGIGMTAHQIEGLAKGEYFDLSLNEGGNNPATIEISSSAYFITHIKLSDIDDDAIPVSSTWFNAEGAGCDIDVDLQKSNGSNPDYNKYQATTTESCYLGKITVTYADAARTYTITYNNAVKGENGVTNNNPISYTVETTGFTIADPSRTGYDFECWKRDVGGSLTTVTAPIVISTSSVIETKNLDLYAYWNTHTYTVRFDRNGGNGITVRQAFTYDQAQDLSANTFSRTGYHFAGWNTESDGSGTTYTDGQRVSNLTAENGATVVLYAQWEINTYTVRFNGNGAEGSMQDQAFTYDQAQALTANIFSKTGYHFVKWTTASDGSGDSYDDEAEILNLTAVNGAVIDLYAKWEINTYTVRFNGNGAVGSMEDMAFIYDEQRALTANTFSRTGYNFKGWNTASDGSGTSYTDEAVVSNVTVEHGAVIDLYAQWEAKTIAVTFDWGNEATGGTTSVTATYDAPMPAITLPTWEGHCFGGYWSEADGWGELYYDAEGTLNTTCRVTSDALTLYAYWLDPITYIDADGIEKTCTQYEVIDFNMGRVLGKDNADNWYTIIGGIKMADIVFKGNAHIIMPKYNADIRIDFIYADGGDVHIYGTEDGESEITSEIRVVGERKGDVFIHGGNVELSIRDANSINIGWTNTNDEITLSINNEATVTIKEGQYFYNDMTGVLNGTVSNSMIDNSTLYPVIPMSDDAANSSVIASYSNKLGGIGLLGRTIYNDGAWNTICIPGGVIRGNGINPINNLYTIMELDTEGKYNDAGQADEGGTYQTGIKDGILYLYFKETTIIDPGKPYIVRYNGTSERHIVDPFFGGTMIADVSAYSGTDAEKCQAFLDANAATSQDGSVRFIGQFDPVTIDDSNRGKIIVLGADNTLGYTMADALHTMRAHFEILGANNIKGYQIGFGEGGTTGIIPIKDEPAAQGIYTLDGLRIEGHPTKKGVYIKDGKKVMIKD